MELSNMLLVVLVNVAQAVVLVAAGEAHQQMQISKNCTDECGGVRIPYPFGIGEGCFYNHTGSDGKSYGLYYKISCNNSTNPPTPIYGKNIPVLNITVHDHSFRINAPIAYDCYKNNESSSRNDSSLSLVEFTVSTTRNKFMAIGCDTQASISGYRSDKYYFTGCMTYCTSIEDIKNGTCNGVGCCEASIPDGTTNVVADVGSYYNHNHSLFNPCSAAFVVEKGGFSFSTANLTSPESHFTGGLRLRLPMVFDWSILGNGNCTTTGTLCGPNTNCTDNENGTKGYRCKCLNGYDGNPYLQDGCQDVDECLVGYPCKKGEDCANKEGGYDCICPSGYHHDNATESCIPIYSAHLSIGVKLALGIGIGLILFLVGGILLQLYRQKKKLLNMKLSFFHNNGGLILHRELRGRNISVQKFKIFTTEELDKATECFSEGNVVGRGGFGKVYKGTLPDGQLIAIKRSLKVDPTQVEQFVNETLVLSEINNRNVVKLLGCCLETEVPSLVYEFINNGTLYEHLQDEGKASHLSWGIRLRIAESVASVLSYLHTTIAIPIIHRDMKSMNILLDENYTAKVSDFGASKLVPMDEDQLATVVLGTCGYLDPEYMQTHELTQKSDVYSFGVVLVELLTRKKAICYNMPEAERSLAMHFLCKMKEDCLFDIVDHAILMNDNLEQVKQVAVLARQCLSLRGEERPTMKEIAIELESIRKLARHPSYNVVTLSEECESLVMTYPVEDNDQGGATDSTTSNIPEGNLLLDLGDGR